MPHTPPPRLDRAALTATLARALPVDLREGAEALVEAILSLADGHTSAEADTRLSPTLTALAGQVVRSEQALIRFGAGSQMSDVHISDIAGGDIYHLTIHLTVPPPPPRCSPRRSSATARI